MVDDPASISGYLVEGSRDIDLTRQLGAIAKRRGIEAQITSAIAGAGIKGIHTYRRSGGDIPLFGHGSSCYKLSGQEYTLEKTTTEDFAEGTYDNIVTSDNELKLDPDLAETITEDYYEEGEQHVSWKQGYALRTPTIEMRDGYIYMLAFDSELTGEAAVVTVNKVDLTHINTLFIDWMNDGYDTTSNISSIIVSSVQMDDTSAYDKKLSVDRDFSRQISSLDVSDLEGEYYIRVHATGLNGTLSRLYVYNIYGTTEDAYDTQGSWLSPVYTIPSTPISSRLDWEADIPDNTDPEATINLVFRVRGSHDGQIWGDWQTVTASGGGIPLTKHYQVQINFTALKAFGSPSVQSFTITYTTATDTAISIKTGLSGDRLRFIDYEDVCYFTDGGRPQRFDGSLVSDVGIDPPSAAPTIADSGMTGSPNGTYTAKVTFINEYGTESNGSDASESLTVSSKQISWSNIPTGPTGTKSRNLYRTKSGGDIYYFVAAIDDNTTTTYTDDTSDANLITELETDNNIPPDSTIIYEHLNYMLYVSADNPGRLYYSKPGKPDSVPPNNYKEFPGPIKAVRIYQNMLVVGGDKFTSAVFGDIWDSDPAVDNTAVKTISESYGPLSHEAMVQCFSSKGDILVFPTRQGLNYLTPGLQENSMRSVPLSRQVQPIFDGAVNPENMAAIYDKNRYILALNYFGTDTPIQTNNIILVLDLRTGEWNPPWHIPSSGFTVSNGNVYFGSPTIGQVYKLDAGTSDDGENIHAIAKLNVDYTPLGPHKKKRFVKGRIAVTPDSDTASLQFKPSVDGIQATMEPGAINTWGGVYVSPKMRIQLQRGYEYQVTIEDESTKDWVIPKIITEYERGE
jgi:hypothetical protein